MADGIRFAETDQVLEITLDHPPSNLWTEGMLVAAMQRLRAAAGGSDLLALRLRAAGDTFCLGRERAASARDAVSLRAEAQRLVDMLRAWTTTPLLTLVELHGDAAGFGSNLAGLADLTIAASTARLAFPEIKTALAATVVLSWLPATIGYQRAMALVTTGEPIDAATACAYGLVTRVVAPEAVSSAAESTLATWRGLDATALREIKRFAVRTRYWHPDQVAAVAADTLVLSALAASDA